MLRIRLLIRNTKKQLLNDSQKKRCVKDVKLPQRISTNTHKGGGVVGAALLFGS